MPRTATCSCGCGCRINGKARASVWFWTVWAWPRGKEASREALRANWIVTGTTKDVQALLEAGGIGAKFPCCAGSERPAGVHKH
ncbi:hypothetical protein MPNT_10244 [Candidatus Methylacidithermus pantelleriae]|uniref:Uncharacterized protein n=1 Tax=Candidatus Methylacidithermus pantelleriae TaxID=2744239 RepID=A0A8J2FUZ9_9BACT|nr:hypothetical protein MPNT_10244 [Candidatus Methylacidithermus pantelleriae]